MGKGFDLFERIAAELFADHFQLVIEAAGANGDFGGAFLHQIDKAQAGGLGVAGWVSVMISGVISPLHVILRQAQILQAQDLALVHLDAAIDLPQVFPKGDLVDQRFDLAELAVRVQSASAQPCIWRRDST
jgi:hypothetical protein